MSYLPFNSKPLIAIYENSGQTVSSTGETLLQVDSNLHQGILSSSAFTLNNFDCYLTADIKYDKGSGSGYDAALRMYIDNSLVEGSGAVQSGTASGAYSGSGGEIISSNISAGQQVQIKINQISSAAVSLNAFTRIIGVIT